MSHADRRSVRRPPQDVPPWLRTLSVRSAEARYLLLSAAARQIEGRWTQRDADQLARRMVQIAVELGIVEV